MAKRIRVSQVIVPPGHDTEHVKKKACRMAGIRAEDVRRFEIVRQSIDARDKGAMRYVYTVDLITGSKTRCFTRDRRVQEVTLTRYEPGASGAEKLTAPIAVVGTGPAGMFCGLVLAMHGYRPIMLERGRRVEDRTEDVERFWNGGALDPESNVQFGEGGAGTFSDGKLNTSVRDKQGRNRFVLETFVRFGAPEDILYVSQPHIGTDILRLVVANMREEIIRLGGTFCFSSAVRDIETVPEMRAEGQMRLTALLVEKTDGAPCTDQEGPEGCCGWERLETSAAVFATGHSARDTFAMLRYRGADMVPKPFAVGMRVEHPQADIDRSQYGEEAVCRYMRDGPGEEPGGSAAGAALPHASYRLTYRASNGRSVYSFCMCPGGYVVNASSEKGRTAINGMSDRARDGENANSAIIVSVTPEDFPDPKDPLSGIAFQRRLEERAFAAGGGRIPQQRFGDFAEDPVKGPSGKDAEGMTGRRYVSCTKGEAVQADLRAVFPDDVREAFIEGMHAFSRSIEGFDRGDVVLSAVESRTSSPVCITRNGQFESNISGIYPCGEGAGYAGGITSAAMDGMRVAEALMKRFAPVG